MAPYLDPYLFLPYLGRVLSIGPYSDIVHHGHVVVRD